ncbi:tyrosine-type recombinase/integrase [Peptostreptococcus anaerobius]|uniref:tyrosine-type recombinase/integrase n=1 Tax=Peptostreptococcus anaerobius TaxID=1261 RepID=UPI002551A5BB|nr:tyrosine-type recombinase/integrase [Peptostreptococcus anaerobius]MDK8278299.1 tyrosine-type recombinase/integrase [Peptostreptococcus anaerobius]
MRNPNGYGSIYKLSGKRRRPWAVRKTVGWDFNKDTGKTKPIYEFVGYYTTRSEAMQALANYNESPYDIGIRSLTFEGVYDRWSNIHFDNISQSNINGYKAAYKLCSTIKDMSFAEIRLDHLQKVVDTSGKNTPSLKKLKIMLGLMYDYAVIHDIVPVEKRQKIKYLDISKPGNPNVLKRSRFSDTEIRKVWKVKDNDIYYSVVLMLLYTGPRVSELLDVKKENVNLKEKWYFIPKSKTQAGIRYVPIPDKVLPFFEYWMARESEYLICTPDGKKMTYDKFYSTHWKKIMAALEIKHTPHCARYTTISKLTEAGVDDRIIKQIVGHQGKDVTEIVYTDIDMSVKLEAINKI